MSWMFVSLIFTLVQLAYRFAAYAIEVWNGTQLTKIPSIVVKDNMEHGVEPIYSQQYIADRLQ